MVFTDILLTRLDATTLPANWKWKDRGKSCETGRAGIQSTLRQITPDADSTEAASIDLNWLGGNRDVACYGLHEYDAALARWTVHLQAESAFPKIFQMPTCNV